MTYLHIGIPILISAIIAYLFGSINTAIIVTKIVTKGGNIKEMGSKNAGFTNVLRCVGKGPAIVTIVCDFLKAVVAVLISMAVFSIYFSVISSAGNDIQIKDSVMYIEGMGICEYVAGYCCILGHMFPLYFRFKGGKGVVAAIGMMLILDWKVFLIILCSFLIVFAFSRIISLGSLVGAALYAPATFVTTYFFVYKPSLTTGTPLSVSYAFILTAIALLGGVTVIVKHHSNIGRLIRGEEKKITAKKK